MEQALWEKVKFKLETMIITDIYKSAHKVPSMAELSEMYKIGKSTAKKVLESMYKDGTLIKKRGVGYFVKPYVKNKLIKKHTETINARLYNLIYLNKCIGRTEEEIKTEFFEGLEAIYSR